VNLIPLGYQKSDSMIQGVGVAAHLQSSSQRLSPLGLFSTECNGHVQLGDCGPRCRSLGLLTRSEGSSAVKYFFFVSALMHAPVSLSAESALPPAQRPAFAAAKRSSKDTVVNCLWETWANLRSAIAKTPVSAASRVPHAAIALSAGAFDSRLGEKGVALANGA
jgi:hypothetical protein